MKNCFEKQTDGYQDSIRRGMKAMRLYSGRYSHGMGTREDNLQRLKTELEKAEAVVVGAGAGLSTSAGLTYSGERFQAWFGDFARKYGITDMYSGGFYPFPNPESMWAWWSRHIYVNRYIDAPKPVYPMLRELLRDKNYFVITTNVDHQFQRAGFDKERLFYTQGDYGLWQSVNPKIQKTYDNRDAVLAMMEAQGFQKGSDGSFLPPEEGETITMRIPTALIPLCPDDGSDMTMNLRSDDSFVEDEGWHAAAARYGEFLKDCEGKHVLFLELGVGGNTPVIIKFPFWEMTGSNPRAVYACLNYCEAVCPQALEEQSVCLDGDILEVLELLCERRSNL